MDHPPAYDFTDTKTSPAPPHPALDPARGTQTFHVYRRGFLREQYLLCEGPPLSSPSSSSSSSKKEPSIVATVHSFSRFTIVLHQSSAVGPVLANIRLRSLSGDIEVHLPNRLAPIVANAYGVFENGWRFRYDGREFVWKNTKQDVSKWSSNNMKLVEEGDAQGRVLAKWESREHCSAQKVGVVEVEAGEEEWRLIAVALGLGVAEMYKRSSAAA